MLAALPRTAAANSQLFADDAPLRTNSSDTTISLDFFGITGWATYSTNENLRTNGGQSHFKIRYAPFFVNRADLTPLFQYLEEAYTTYDQMGFSYDNRTRWPVEVTVKNIATGEDGLFVRSFWGNNYTTLQFNQNIIKNLPELRSTAGHEFFHFIQYLYDTRGTFVRNHKTISRTISIHWLDEATAVWAEEKFTNTPTNYVSSIFKDREREPFNGMEAGTNGNNDKAAIHGYGMSAFIKYLTSRYGESIVRDIYLQILNQQHPVQAINLAINHNLFMIWENFLREYVCGNIYNVPKSEFIDDSQSGIFRIRSDTDRSKTFTETYPDLSAKRFSIGLNYPNISPAKAINFTIDQDLCDITLFKIKRAGIIEYVSHSTTKTLTLKNIRSLTDNGYNLFLMVTNSNYFNTPKIYTNSMQIKLDILVESIAAAMTLSTSKNKLNADSTSTSTITASVTDDVGDPVEGETVTFTTTSGSLSAESVDTDTNGIASVIYTAPSSAPPSGTSTITATTTNAITETVVITVNASPAWAGWPASQWCPKTATGEYQWGGTYMIYPPNNPKLNFLGIECHYWGNAQLESETVYLIKNESDYLNRMPDGWRKKYFESGALEHQVRYETGKKEGTSTRFYESGSIESQTPYINGLAEGNCVCYYESGQIQSVIPFQSDQRNGMAHSFYDTGERSRDEPWQNGLRHGIKKGYYRSGPLEYEHPYTNGKKNGMTKGYYENGNRKYEKPYTNGKKNGISKEYWDNDQLKSEIPYTNDIADGTQFYYDQVGKLYREVPYTNGVKHGIEKRYDLYNSNQVSHLIPWQNGVMHGQEKEYALDRQLISCKTYDNGTYTGSCMP
ncbi:MAG: hypothetical protein DRP47_12710 [Candidatus Zixiibacteriota bacterium]|nr:MAG: hypothetical protein DRP47_12710 [candidate division Zixibacteria bacterium]